MARTSADGKQRSTGRGFAGASLGRMLSLLAFLPVASRIPDYARLVTALVLDERPRSARSCSGRPPATSSSVATS